MASVHKLAAIAEAMESNMIHKLTSNRKWLVSLHVLVVSAGFGSMLSCKSPTPPQPRPDEAVLAELRQKVRHVVVIYQENWSFDGLYGSFPGANGITNAGAAANQTRADGTPYDHLPQPIRQAPPAKPSDCEGEDIPDDHFPATQLVAPFNMRQYLQPDKTTGDLVHRFYHEQLQIDRGKMDRFVAWSDNPGLVMGYFDVTDMPEGKLAQQYVLCDNFFHSAFGGSFLNHQFLIAAAAPTWPEALTNPDLQNLVSEPIDQARLGSMREKDLKDNDRIVTREGYVVNTAYPARGPHPSGAKQLVPPQEHPTIGDRLTDKLVSWKWYSGGWNQAIAPSMDQTFECKFQFHHQPFAYFKNYAEGTPGRREHLADEDDFLTDLSSDSLPAVCFIKPFGPDNEHPGYADLERGQKHVAKLVDAVQKSNAWGDTVIIIAYDENGGRWDHVAPPPRDAFGPGTRIPAIIISPMAKNWVVDHTQYETASILKFIESIFDLPPLNARDAKANNLLAAFVTSPLKASEGAIINWQMVASIAAVTSTIVLTISLIFILFQIRQQTKLARMANAQTLVQLSSPFNLQLIQDRDMAALWVNGERDYDKFDAVRQYQYESLIIWWLILHENIYYQWRNGLLDPDLRLAWDNDLRDFIKRRTIGLEKTRVREFCHRAFGSYIDEIGRKGAPPQSPQGTSDGVSEKPGPGGGAGEVHDGP
jgi:acid phosphatase